MLWAVVRHCYDAENQVKGRYLQKNDIIKIGRVRFKIRDINSSAY